MVYPLMKRAGWIRPSNTISSQHPQKSPPESIYSLPATLIDGKSLQLQDLKGKKILLVNTASDCLFTSQYTELNTLFIKNSDRLVVLGFPANDFRNQEKGG